MKNTLTLISGLIFGIGLAISGMTNPTRVIGFLDITSAQWDPTLALVMAGALGTFTLGAILLHKKLVNFPKGESDPISRRLIIGAILFGAGWGIAGFCPGPALANLITLRTDALVFVATMTLGMLIAQRGFGADSSK